MKDIVILDFGDFKIPFSHKNGILKPKGEFSENPPISIHENTTMSDIADDLYRTTESKRRLFGPEFKKRQELEARIKRLLELKEKLRIKKAKELEERKKIQMLKSLKPAPKGKIGKLIFHHHHNYGDEEKVENESEEKINEENLC
jgi:hypothetical protein